MPRVVEINPSHTPSQLGRLAASTKDANQSRRLLSIAAVLDGMSRAETAKICGMDRQTLRDWVRRFNAHGPGDEGRRDCPAMSTSDLRGAIPQPSLEATPSILCRSRFICDLPSGAAAISSGPMQPTGR